MSWDNTPPGAKTVPGTSFDANPPGASTPEGQSFDTDPPAGATVDVSGSGFGVIEDPDEFALNALFTGQVRQLDPDTGSALATYDIDANSAIDSANELTVTVTEAVSPLPQTLDEHNWEIITPDGRQYKAEITVLPTLYDLEMRILAPLPGKATVASESFNSGAPGTKTVSGTTFDSNPPGAKAPPGI